jgi:hypothetical protein
MSAQKRGHYDSSNQEEEFEDIVDKFFSAFCDDSVKMEILHNFFSALVSYDPDKDIEESDKMNDLLHEIHYLRDPSRILGTDVCEVQKFYMAGGNVNAMLFGSPIIKELLEDQMEETETLVNQLKTLISLGADVNATGKMEKLLCPQH